MRVLLISYEFPPIESAQSFRWHYLSRHLARRGVEITVLTPEFSIGPTASDAEFREVLRTYPGPFVGISAWIASKSSSGHARAGQQQDSFGESRGERIYRAIRKMLDKVVFPDVRTEWYPFARRMLGRLRQERFDLIVASHEPGVDLMLGMYASREWGLPLVIDLADPLVTPYSPGWRKSLDTRLERKACECANGVITTSRTFSSHLKDEYGLQADKVIEIEQGHEFHEAMAADVLEGLNIPRDQFWLLFTGNFYRDFRNPQILLSALRQRPSVQLVYAGHTPDWLADLFEPLGRQIHCLGRMQHSEVVGLQRQAPALFSLGNAQSRQVPGKLFEYFGAGRPILHIALNPTDPSKEILSSRQRGIAVDADVEQVVGALDRLQVAWARGTLESDWDLSHQAVADFSWESLSGKLLGFLQQQVVETR
jgi:glycosyltransferase involved in cell wall biosynthesis